ncbi:uncharacterized protein LOC127260822 [Andrographis paniculata]|uniref:uncharacterized protein LOC127260822 n=1 Tax=Andrographis paniculata TaxID=175694 RepID=UPI0021E831FC|nr:uncharacterized protein LOC127260822 [Andrographis paniculata]
MGEHLVVNVDQLPPPEAAGTSQSLPRGGACDPPPPGGTVAVGVDNEDADEQAPLIGMGECRICQEEDSLDNLERPCACSWSLMYAHRKCVQHWCDEKGDITCEICHQPYQPGYTTPPRPPSDETTIDISGVWRISDAPMDIHDPRFLAIADAERQFLESEYDDYNGMNTSGTAFCRSAVLILMALLLLRHAVSLADDGDAEGDGAEDASTFFSLLLLRAVGFLLPCYIMIWAINILQRRRQRQEAAALSAARLAIIVQAAERRGLIVASATPAQANPRTG